MIIHGAKLAAAMAGMALVAGSAQAVGTPPAPTKAPDVVAVTAEKRYCIIDRPTGSRIPVKTCQTRKDWLARGFDPLAPKD